MDTHLSIVMRFFFIFAFKAKLCRLLYICECFLNGFPLAITTHKRGVNCNKETILVSLDDNWEPTLMVKLFHWSLV